MSYCHYNNAFSNKESDDLDKMARKLNNDRKKNKKYKEHMLNVVQKGIQQDENNTYDGMEMLMDPAYIRYAPLNNMSEFGFFSTQGDFSSKLPTPLTQNKTISEQSDSDQSITFSDIESNQSFSSLSNIDLSSNYSSMSPKKKKHLRSSSKHLKQYSDNDDAEIIHHLKKCEQCKTQLFQILQKDSHPINYQIQSTNNQQQTEHFGKILNISASELKDVMILLLIGIFIIIVLDFFYS